MDSASIAVLKSTIAELQALVHTFESTPTVASRPSIVKKPAQVMVRHSAKSFLDHGKKVADDEGWANGCRFPRKSWPLKEDGKEYAKLQDLAAALQCECEKGTNGSEIYLHFGASDDDA